MRVKRRITERIRNLTRVKLQEKISSSVINWPLPEPPLQSPELPPIHPSKPEDIENLALALYDIDSGLFIRLIESTLEEILPYRRTLMEEDYEEHEKWLIKREHEVAEKILYGMCQDWLSQSLDESSPDSDRWWLSIVLFNGLSDKDSKIAINQGYHLIESIAIASKPGRWHSKPEVGSHMVDWNPDVALARMELVSHPLGNEAAKWQLDCLGKGSIERKKLLAEWVLILFERPPLVESLNLLSYVESLIETDDEEILSIVSKSVPKMIELFPEKGLDILSKLSTHKSRKVRFSVADILPRSIKSSMGVELTVLDRLLSDVEPSIVSAASAALSEVRVFDEQGYIDRVITLSKNSESGVKRAIIPHLRYYISNYLEDQYGLIKYIWADGDEIILTRMREVLLRLEGTEPANFANLYNIVYSASEENTSVFWKIMQERNSERAKLWQDYFSGEGTLPPSNK